jgi:hypothetical protein
VKPQGIRAFCAVHPSISVETVTELMRRGLLHLNGDCWRFGDQSNRGVTRSLGDLDWKHSHTSAPAWHGLIGLSDVIENDRREVVLVIEGSKDALAAAEIAQRKGVLHEVGILAALGSGYRPIRSELKQLRGRRVTLVSDNDVAGRQTLQLVANAFDELGVDCNAWQWNENEPKDLYEWLARADAQEVSCVEQFPSTGVNGKFCPPSSPSPCSTVQLKNEKAFYSGHKGR